MTTAAFIALVAVLAALAIHTVLRTSRGDGRPPRPHNAVIVAVLLTLYLILPGVLARAGALDRYAPLPAPALIPVLALAILTVILAMSGVGARIVTATGMAGLVGFQAFRIPVEWLLHRLFLEGVIPVQMTYVGRNFDIVSGITAAILGLWLASGRHVPRGWIVAWNLLGLALLANIITIALLSTPVPFRYFLEGPPNRLPSTFPFVWLPTFLVQVALFGHLLVFRKLAQRQN